MSTGMGAHEMEIRIFTPPRPMLNGCILPGPERQLEGFQGRDVRARTEQGRPAWWCKVDRVVVFDGVEGDDEGGQVLKYKTRSSKGLSIARRRGDSEVVIIPLDCAHCQEMLNRQEWKYDVQVCKRSVCWECRERCMWEDKQEIEQGIEGKSELANMEKNRERADSVLADEQARDEELMRKLGIETGPKSPIQAVGGIEERLEAK
ncbi:hypothetical protein K491DRAFT_771856 [Lophiostoma macrostomum CBS 122681]|uniref:Uncharacterized protein n=1 Tax=Lophiostoma macrostomum CBS 122681 TaxID=1314788 RepID=A0A6A6SMT5_9PLEO|nr:hypothetical protein K491DRAFT_771856 [Lophiostoma macrostomum CBS 122681]